MADRINHLLSTRDLDPDFVRQLFTRAEKLKRMRGQLSAHERILDGEIVANLFWEVSTRTRLAFELAAVRLGAHVVNLIPRESSVAKGENLSDTVNNLRALGCRFFVLRHPDSGEAARLAERLSRGVHLINGGDGTNEHPSQALLDAFTIRERRKSVEGQQIAILGDLLRSRTAHSDIYLFNSLGAQVRVAGPPELMPEKFDAPVKVCKTADEAVTGADVVMMLRIQRERRGASLDLSDEEYLRKYGLTPQRLALAQPDALVMHPGPMNRGVEIDAAVADGPQSVILRQAENGLFMRMAIFEALRGERG